MGEMVVSKKVSFDAAHFLPGYKGKCSRTHGHRWTAELGIKGEVGEDGMVVDFTRIKAFLDEIEEDLDHTLINDKIPNPTAENICLYIRSKLGDIGRLGGDKWLQLAFIRVWETEDSMAELRC